MELLEHEFGNPAVSSAFAAAPVSPRRGRVLLPHAEAALAALKDGGDAVSRAAVRPARARSRSRSWAPSPTRRSWMCCAAFARRTGEVRLELRTASSAEVTALVSRGEATLGLALFHSPAPGSRRTAGRQRDDARGGRAGSSPRRPTGARCQSPVRRAVGRVSAGQPVTAIRPVNVLARLLAESASTPPTSP